MAGRNAGLFILERTMTMEETSKLEIPELKLQPPIGLGGIVREFGDIGSFVQADGCLDPRWESQSLAMVTSPFALVLAWDHSKMVSAFRCHKRLRGIFAQVFGHIIAAGLASKVRSFGGCFMYRPQRTGAKVSTHSWGIAIDLNPETNGLGSVGDMDPGVVRVFRDAGFEWGGEWAGRGRDPMHFQYCRSY
jgi:hypothetical protein